MATLKAIDLWSRFRQSRSRSGGLWPRFANAIGLWPRFRQSRSRSLIQQ
ncbi:MAG: hypothetical protein F6K26_05480 [Moorea sp. SIO2I5]|nr:hypothetical protein [Moorena sp. SIO2I5]